MRGRLTTMRPKIHRGITRTVLLVGRWAIKVPSLRTHGHGLAGALWSWCRGVLANQSESEWSGHGTCPVLWTWAGLISVYPRCAPAPELTDAEYDAIGLPGPMDRKPQNVGYLHGELVWLDYDMNWNDCRRCGTRDEARA